MVSAALSRGGGGGGRQPHNNRGGRGSTGLRVVMRVGPSRGSRGGGAQVQQEVEAYPGVNNRGKGSGRRGQGGGGRGSFRGNLGRGGLQDLSNINKHASADGKPNNLTNPSNSTQNQQGPPDRKPFNRRGPVFGFMRLHQLVSCKLDDVIMSISKDLEAWGELLSSEALVTSSSDDLLVLVVNILANKICHNETLLTQQQIGILVKSNTEKFFSKLMEKCQKLMFGSEVQPSVSFGLTEIDNSPKTFLTNVHKYAAFMVRKMSHIAIDYLKGTITTAIGTVMTLSTSDSTLSPLAISFQELRLEMQSLVKQEEDKKPKQRGFFNRRQFTEQEQEILHSQEAPDDYRNMTIVPTAEELLSKDEVFLRPIKSSGAYTDANHYLDVHFRLLREDFVQPLKKGIQDFMKNRFDYMNHKKRLPLGTIRIYPNVQIVDVELVRENFVYKIQLTDDIFKKIKWDRSKRLLTGSLIVCTVDFFKTAYFAVIASRNVSELSKGIVSITWVGARPAWEREDEYLMVECEVYFEAFRHTLLILKNLELETFPMCKYIVDSSSEVGPPKYLENAEQLLGITLNQGTEMEETLNFSPLLESSWPSKESLGLDENQFAAFKGAITKEFVIIQGPPGTGKTYLGLRIAEVYLKNQDLWMETEEQIQNPSKVTLMPARPIKIKSTGPILCVCYTNHALDQFLEGIVEIFEKISDKPPPIIRVGGRCQSEKLQRFTLQNVARESRSTASMPDHFFTNRTICKKRIDEFEYERACAINAVRGMRDLQGVINFEKLDVWEELAKEFPAALWNSFRNLAWFGIKYEWFLRGDFYHQNSILNSWFQIQEFTEQTFKQISKQPQQVSEVNNEEKIKKADDDFDEDYDLNELMEHRAQDDVYSGFKKQNTPVHLERYLQYFQSVQQCDEIIQKCIRKVQKLENDEANRVNMTEINDLKKKIQVNENQRNFFYRLFTLYKNNQIMLPDVTGLPEHLEALQYDNHLDIRWTMAEKWAIYFKVVERARALSAKRAKKFEQLLVEEHKKLNDLKKYGDSHLLRHSRVVGMTTTGAAKYNDLLQTMKTKIVIVEEAAEVLESHIVTCITKHCEHLILIGDHRQLRPSTTVYELAKKYNLDLSLFERMLNNKLSCYPLKVQHRMRPEISNLVRGTIYEELIDFPNVLHYERVKGVTKNLFFFSHRELEKSDSDSKSKSNAFEAKFLAGLCRYLVLQGYNPSQITVLSTYTGQMFLLKQTIFNFPTCHGVRVTCVDNFQGEENDIILLSLVRSNLDSKVGFLAVENRVCVALSRAKQGLYIVGNIGMLKSQSSIWAKIEEKLNVRGECGSSLTLECQVHGTISEIQSDKEFAEKVPEGGCTLICDAQLNCTHKCTKICHTKDKEHEEYKCKEPCLKSCVNDHPCKEKCFRTCPQCTERKEPIPKTLPCTHVVKMACHADVNEYMCQVLVKKDLTCDHDPVEMACFIDPAGYECPQEVVKDLPCGHMKNLKCFEDPAIATCKVEVIKKLPCGHDQLTECQYDPATVKCMNLVEITFEDCGHTNELLCKDALNPNKGQSYCKTKCKVRLDCGHACTKFCHVSEDPDHLNYICRKECFKKCLEDHTCPVKHSCNLPCPPCTVKVERKLDCNHKVQLECHLDPEKFKCEERCLKPMVNCYHACQNSCGQPCGPCEELTLKKIVECGHRIKIQCNKVPIRDMCSELVPSTKRSLCLHKPLVPCSISQNGLPEVIMQHCKEPCQEIFLEAEGGCGHRCGGTCATCLGGRFHQKCESKCGKTLVCGHVCVFPCTEVCPPCDKLCLMKCEHSVCQNKCGNPCQNCAEKCQWQCEHKRCSKHCGEMCDREPCDEPCPKILEKCGHPCVGFCGEPCPSLCRICDKDELTEFQLLYTEDDENARFVLLPDCNHTIEVEGLTMHMNMSNTDGEIGVKRCPRCRTIIQSCHRFGNIIRKHLEDVFKVKKIVFGNQREVKKFQTELINELKLQSGSWDLVLPALWRFIIGKLTNMVPVKKGSKNHRMMDKKVDLPTLKCLKEITRFGEIAVGILFKSKTELYKSQPLLHAELFKRYRDFFREIMSRQLPLSSTELRDIGRESDRLFDLNQVFLRRASPKFTDGHSRALPIYDRLKSLVLSNQPYTEKSKEDLRRLFNELEDVLRTGLGITELEKRQILSATGLKQGHWYKCPNGHIYAIGDCGGPNQGSKCNECGAPIGGQNHQLAVGNSLGREMDGATAPAWPTALLR